MPMSIIADVALEHLQTPAHRFAVFFIKPEESESTKNKELIAALRQVISAYASQKEKHRLIFFWFCQRSKCYRRSFV